MLLIYRLNLLSQALAAAGLATLWPLAGFSQAFPSGPARVYPGVLMTMPLAGVAFSWSQPVQGYPGIALVRSQPTQAYPGVGMNQPLAGIAQRYPL